MDVPGRNLGCAWLVNWLFHLGINGVFWGYNPLILTFDPNFLGHPSGEVGMDAFCHGNLRGPDHPKATWDPQEIAGPNSRPYSKKPMVNRPLIRPYFFGGAPLDCHDFEDSKKRG